MSEITRLILLRHGVTQWNLQYRFQGQADIPLTDLGRQQARRAHQLLQEYSVDVIYSSDLSRALETAQIALGDREIPITTLKELRETNFGQWEGLTTGEIREKFPELMELHDKDPYNTILPDGECRRFMYERATRKVDELATLHRGQTIVIAAHEGPLAAVVCYYLGLDFIPERRKYRMDNASFHIMERINDGPFRLVRMAEQNGLPIDTLGNK